MLDVRVTKFNSRFSSRFVSLAFGSAAIRYDQSVFVLRQETCERIFIGFEVDGAGNMALFVSIRAIDVQENNFFGFDSRFDLSNGNVRSFGRISRSRCDEKRSDQ